MIRSNFLTTADRFELWSCVKRQREDHEVARRANALLLLDDGMSCAQIAKGSVSGRRHGEQLTQAISG